MRNTTTPKGIADLVRLLGTLRQLHDKLGDVIDEKLGAMKRADIHAMRDLGEQEQSLAARIHEREGLRRQVMDRIGDEMGFGKGRARTMNVTQIAEKLRGAERTAFQDEADSLGHSIRRVAQINRVAGATTREMLHHLRWVFASVRPQREETVGYAGDGTLVSPGNTRIFDAVG